MKWRDEYNIGIEYRTCRKCAGDKISVTISVKIRWLGKSHIFSK